MRCQKVKERSALLLGVRLVKCFDMDPGICPVLPFHAATLSRLRMASVHVDGIQGLLSVAPWMPAL